ncbi:hypothetical protein J6590_094378 [Homalodisca vitripennis]|nr:hypothetical protein J6590_094378 [Homalodisca vitripennis]
MTNLLVLKTIYSFLVFQLLDRIEELRLCRGSSQDLWGLLHYREVPLTGMQAELLLPDLQLKLYVSQMFSEFSDASVISGLLYSIKDDELGNSFYDTFDICNDSAAIIRRCVPAATKHTSE